MLKKHAESSLKLLLACVLHDVGIGFIDKVKLTLENPSDEDKKANAAENRELAKLHVLFSYWLTSDDNQLSNIIGVHHEYDTEPYGMRTTYNKLWKLLTEDEKLARENRSDEEKHQAEIRERQQKLLGRKLAMLHEYLFMKNSGLLPLQIAIRLAQGDFLSHHLDVARTIRMLCSDDEYGTLVKPGLIIDNTSEMYKRTTQHQALCQEAEEAIKEKGFQPNLQILITAFRDKPTPTIDYKIVHRTREGKIVSIWEYVDPTKLSIQRITRQPLQQLILTMELPEVNVYYPRPKASS